MAADQPCYPTPINSNGFQQPNSNDINPQSLFAPIFADQPCYSTPINSNGGSELPNNNDINPQSVVAPIFADQPCNSTPINNGGSELPNNNDINPQSLVAPIFVQIAEKFVPCAQWGDYYETILCTKKNLLSFFSFQKHQVRKRLVMIN